MNILAWIIIILGITFIGSGIVGKTLFRGIEDTTKLKGTIVEVTSKGSIAEFDVEGKIIREQMNSIFPVGTAVYGVYEINNNSVVVGDHYYLKLAVDFVLFTGFSSILYAVLVLSETFTNWLTIIVWALGMVTFVMGMLFNTIVKSMSNKHKGVKAVCVEHKELVIENETYYSPVFKYTENGEECLIDNIRYRKDKGDLIAVGVSKEIVYVTDNNDVLEYKALEKYKKMRYILMGLGIILFVLTFFV